MCIAIQMNKAVDVRLYKIQLLLLSTKKVSCLPLLNKVGLYQPFTYTSLNICSTFIYLIFLNYYILYQAFCFGVLSERLIYFNLIFF